MPSIQDDPDNPMNRAAVQRESVGLPPSSDGDIFPHEALDEVCLRVFGSPRNHAEEWAEAEATADPAVTPAAVASMNDAYRRAGELSDGSNSTAAVSILRDAIARFGPALAPFDGVRVRVTLRFSQLLQDQGDLAGAETAVSDLLDANELLGGPPHYVLGLLTMRMGEVLHARGRMEEAGSAFSTASSAFLLGSGPESRDYIIANTRAAETWYAAGRYGAVTERAAEVVLGEHGLSELAAPAQLRSLRALRLGGYFKEAARLLIARTPTGTERAEHIAMWHHELGMCHWDLGQHRAALACWTNAWSLMPQSTDVGALGGVILANMGLEGFAARLPARPTGLLKHAQRFATREADAPSLPVLYLTLFAHVGHGSDTDQRWFLSPEGRALIEGLAARAEEHSQRLGSRHPRTAAVLNTVAVAHWFASDWDKAASLIDDLLTAGSFGVVGRDTVKASIANNGFVANVVLGRMDMAKRMLAQVIEATSSNLDHPLRARAARFSRLLASDPPPPGPLHPDDAMWGLVILPLSDERS